MSNNFNIKKTEYTVNGKDMHIISNFSDFEEFILWATQDSSTLYSKVNKDEFDDVIAALQRHKQGNDSTWLGSPDYAKMEDFTLRDYQNLTKLNKTIEKFTDSLNPSLFNTLKKKKLRFNDTFGNFSFDRASQGLFILNELYSPSQSRVVDERDVLKKNNNFYLKSDNSPVIQRKEQRDDGSHLYRTSVRSVFAMFPEVPQQATSVELISIIGHSANKTASEILWTGIATIVIANLLTQANIPVKITGMRMYSNSARGNPLFSIEIPVKNFNETLDENQVAFTLSDPAFFRFFGFLATIRGYSEFYEKAVPDSIAYSISQGHYPLLQPFLKETREEGTVPLIFPQVYSERECEQYITDTISKLATLFNGATP